ncbi:hypothetical protein L596_026834 [Steinernema carpocapsae]|uniref:Uncharacterized protein n=1 Tax=Steinernema carpocapsae TaxID=34508 RepID=A0A4U5M2L0_STECR|nr:hypothetical protein L596_026834 [Steinernema carpocapsae]
MDCQKDALRVANLICIIRKTRRRLIDAVALIGPAADVLFQTFLKDRSVKEPPEANYINSSLQSFRIATGLTETRGPLKSVNVPRRALIRIQCERTDSHTLDK